MLSNDVKQVVDRKRYLCAITLAGQASVVFDQIRTENSETSRVLEVGRPALDPVEESCSWPGVDLAPISEPLSGVALR